MLSQAACAELRAAALARGSEVVLNWVRDMLSQPEPERPRMRFVGDDDHLSRRETYND
jgi:hypothetical protein